MGGEEPVLGDHLKACANEKRRLLYIGPLSSCFVASGRSFKTSLERRVGVTKHELMALRAGATETETRFSVGFV